jgi:Zn-finger nucleic acid-binding protein
VIIDQCTECRGVFLDRGEIDRLIEAEGVRGAAEAPSPAAPSPAVSTASDGAPARAEAPRDKQTQDRGRGGLFGNVMDIFGGGE